MTIVSSGVRGLDLVAGGGVRLVARALRLKPMTSVLIRGPAGAGKSVLAAQLARSLALASQGNVLYGCVEVLPSEIDAQQRGLVGERGAVQVLTERGGPRDIIGDGRLIATVLDADTGLAALDRSLRHALALSIVAKNATTVVVIDSLAGGYRLTNRARRMEADAMLKNAASSGYTLVLVEEAPQDSAPSVWSYVVDTVIELHPPPLEDVIASDRRLSVTKHRYLPSVPGRHRFTIAPNEGVRVFPPLSAYTALWARPNAPAPAAHSWALDLREDVARAPKPVGLISVYGGSRHNVWSVALRMTHSSSPTRRSLFVLLGGSSALDAATARLLGGEGDPVFHLDPMVSAERAVAEILDMAMTNDVGRVVVGDLRALKEYPLAAGLLRGLHTIAQHLGGTPVVLVEHAKPDTARGPAFADVIVEVQAPNAPYSGTLSSRVSLGDAGWTLSSA